jgi:hypothetical protein
MASSSCSSVDEAAPEAGARPPPGGQEPRAPTIIRPARGLSAVSLADAVRGGGGGGAVDAAEGATAAVPSSSPASVPIPIPIPPRLQLEPGGWVGGAAVGETPPGVTRASSETLEAALTARVARLGGGGGGGGRPPGPRAPGTASTTAGESESNGVGVGGGGGGGGSAPPPPAAPPHPTA